MGAFHVPTTTRPLIVHLEMPKTPTISLSKMCVSVVLTSWVLPDEKESNRVRMGAVLVPTTTRLQKEHLEMPKMPSIFLSKMCVSASIVKTLPPLTSASSRGREGEYSGSLNFFSRTEEESDYHLAVKEHLEMSKTPMILPSRMCDPVGIVRRKGE